MAHLLPTFGLWHSAGERNNNLHAKGVNTQWIFSKSPNRILWLKTPGCNCNSLFGTHKHWSGTSHGRMSKFNKGRWMREASLPHPCNDGRVEKEGSHNDKEAPYRGPHPRIPREDGIRWCVRGTKGHRLPHRHRCLLSSMGWGIYLKTNTQQIEACGPIRGEGRYIIQEEQTQSSMSVEQKRIGGRNNGSR